jgi:tetraspanin-9
MTFMKSHMQILGGGIIGVAIWLQISYNGFVTLLPQHELLSLDSAAFLSGTLLFVIAFCGCSGAWFMNPCLLISVNQIIVLYSFVF